MKYWNTEILKYTTRWWKDCTYSIFHEREKKAAKSKQKELNYCFYWQNTHYSILPLLVYTPMIQESLVECCACTSSQSKMLCSSNKRSLQISNWQIRSLTNRSRRIFYALTLTVQSANRDPRPFLWAREENGPETGLRQISPKCRILCCFDGSRTEEFFK